MEHNTADFTQKELCLLLSTICEHELGVIVAKDIKEVRAKADVFANDDFIVIHKIKNKQGKTKVSVFKTQYCGGGNVTKTAYTTTI